MQSKISCHFLIFKQQWTSVTKIHKFYQLNHSTVLHKLVFYGLYFSKKLNSKNCKIKTSVMKSLMEEQIPSGTKWTKKNKLLQIQL